MEINNKSVIWTDIKSSINKKGTLQYFYGNSFSWKISRAYDEINSKILKDKTIKWIVIFQSPIENAKSYLKTIFFENIKLLMITLWKKLKNLSIKMKISLAILIEEEFLLSKTPISNSFIKELLENWAQLFIIFYWYIL